MSSEGEVVHQDCSLTKAGKDDITSDQKTGWTENQETAILSRTNPYCFPERSLFKGLTYNGVPVTNFPVSVDPITHVKRVIAVPMRSDDVIVVAFPKCGRCETINSPSFTVSRRIQNCNFLFQKKEILSENLFSHPKHD